LFSVLDLALRESRHSVETALESHAQRLLVMDVLADAISEADAMKSLAQNWPSLTVLILVLGWFAKYIAHPLATRHLTFIDGLEARDRTATENGIKQTAILDSLCGEVRENTARLSQMRQLVVDGSCKQSEKSCGP